MPEPNCAYSKKCDWNKKITDDIPVNYIDSNTEDGNKGNNQNMDGRRRKKNNKTTKVILIAVVVILFIAAGWLVKCYCD